MIWLLLDCSHNEINIFVAPEEYDLFSDFVDKIGDSKIQVHARVL